MIDKIRKESFLHFFFSTPHSHRKKSINCHKSSSSSSFWISKIMMMMIWLNSEYTQQLMTGIDIENLQRKQSNHIVVNNDIKKEKNLKFDNSFMGINWYLNMDERQSNKSTPSWHNGIIIINMSCHRCHQYHFRLLVFSFFLAVLKMKYKIIFIDDR